LWRKVVYPIACFYGISYFVIYYNSMLLCVSKHYLVLKIGNRPTPPR